MKTISERFREKVEGWRELLLSTDPVDFKNTCSEVEKIFKFNSGETGPEYFLYFSSPLGLEIFNKVLKKDDISDISFIVGKYSLFEQRKNIEREVKDAIYSIFSLKEIHDTRVYKEKRDYICHSPMWGGLGGYRLYNFVDFNGLSEDCSTRILMSLQGYMDGLYGIYHRNSLSRLGIKYINLNPMPIIHRSIIAELYSEGYIKKIPKRLKFVKNKSLSNLEKAYVRLLKWSKFCPVGYRGKICFIVDKPQVLHIPGGVLHRDGAPAYRFRDGVDGWYLNGVSVDRGISEMDADDLVKARPLHKIRNAEIRREYVRKVGIDRLMDHYGGKILSTSPDGMYSLVELRLEMPGNFNFINRFAYRYLKMVNPSTGDIHFEGVPNNIRNITQALNWRNGCNMGPQVLT